MGAFLRNRSYEGCEWSVAIGQQGFCMMAAMNVQGAPMEAFTYCRRCEGRLGDLESLRSPNARNTNFRLEV